MLRRHLIPLIVIITILLLIIHLKIIREAGSLPAPESVYSIPRRIQYGFTLWNSTNRTIKVPVFWTCAPVKETSTQRCVDVKASHPYEIFVDDSGNQFLSFSFKELAPYAIKIINIEAELMLSKKPNYTPVKHPDSYLHAEKYCESDNREIIRLAKALKAEDTQETATNIFKWVSRNIQYTGYTSNIRGALYALNNRKGDCTEFMYLFTALCRATKIPSRCIGGYIIAQNQFLRPEGYHNWSEFYFENSWSLADPQKKSFMENHLHYIAMRVMGKSADIPIGDCDLFGLSGEGIKVTMNG